MTTPARLTRNLLLATALPMALLYGTPAARAAASKIVLVLPGQAFVQGVGAVGTPDPIPLRERFRVEAYAVDAFGNIAYDYEGRVVIPVVPAGGGPVGPPLARRYGTTISRINAPTSIPAGSLRLSLAGGPFQEIAVGAATNPAGICQSIEAGVAAVPREQFDAGEFVFYCRALSSPIPGSLRFTLFLDDGTPVEVSAHRTASGGGGSLIAVDPAFGLAPTLHLGAPVPSGAPGVEAEYAARTLIPTPVEDQRFSRGMAVFEVALPSMSQVGVGQTMGLDQGSGNALPVEASTFDVEPPAFGVVAATAIGDGNGRINKVRLALSQPIVVGTVGSAADFSLEAPGLPPISGTSLSVAGTAVYGYGADEIEVTFGTGLGRTDITDVEVIYTPPSSNPIRGADTGVALAAFSLSNSTMPPLVDGAPPVLVNAVGQDLDSNGGLDRAKFFFSEPVAFSGGRGLERGGLFDPAIDPATMTMPVPFDLRVRQSGLATFEDVVQVVDPDDAAATQLDGADAIANAITVAVQRARPAYRNFTCEFTSGRYVLRAGIPVSSSSFEVLPSGTPNDGAPALKLGVANGGVERPGSGDALAALPADLCIRGQSGANLLLGKTEADLSIVGEVLTLELTNVPNSGTGTPAYLWHDDGDLGFVTDTSTSRLRLEPIDNIGLGSLPQHPSRLLEEALSVTASDGSLARTVVAGDVLLDGSPSFVPLNAPGPETAARFNWTQVDGPFVAIPAHNDGVTTIQPKVAGTYVFELVVQMTVSPDPPVYNPYTDSDGSLSRRLVLTVQPGAQYRSVVVLPGQSLQPGAVSTDEVLDGYALVQTEGTPFEVTVYMTDEFFNVVDGPPGAAVRLATSDPGDVEPPAQPFVGGQATFTLRPSHAATSMVPEVDDEVLVAFEHGDIHWPYVAGSLWSVHALPRVLAAPTLARFTWDDDPRAVRWNIYRTSLPLADLDHDGLPDGGYGSCVSDPDPGDLFFDDATNPPVGGGFMYAARESLVASGVVQAAGLGLTSGGVVRPSPPVCP